jgi:hypothetical protein
LANIQHLKGQLYLAGAALQLKDVTIGQLTATVEQQHYLSGKVLQNSLQLVESSADPGDKEDIVEGVVALRKYEGKGFEINLPELYRRLKRRFLGTGDSKES